MVDYFGKYFNEDGFDFSALINDDFMQPVRILFQAKYYVSASKLLFVAIDSVGYVEYGDIKENTFTKWLTCYCELDKVDVTAEELWEQRNSLLHMSNLDSRKVLSGKIRRLMFYIGDLPEDINLKDQSAGYYNLQQLILEFGHALGRWLNTYGENRYKINDFVSRYDLIASDARMLHIKL